MLRAAMRTCHVARSAARVEPKSCGVQVHYMCVGVQSRAHMRLTTHPDPEPSCDAAKRIKIKRAKTLWISP